MPRPLPVVNDARAMLENVLAAEKRALGGQPGEEYKPVLDPSLDGSQ